MLKAMKQKLDQQKLVWAEGTAQRIEEYAKTERLQFRKNRKREEERNYFLHQEMEKYLYTIHPSFLLNPDAARALQRKLAARSEGRFSFSLHVTSEIRLALDFYHSDLSVFIKLLEKKGFQLQGNEERFLAAFLNKLSENNYKMYQERYGDFVNSSDSLEDAVCCYLELADDNNKYESGRIDFLRKYLINKELLVSEINNKKMKRLLKSCEKKHAEDYKVTRLEKRMGEIG